jgi:Restriction endonuclease S subunits
VWAERKQAGLACKFRFVGMNMREKLGNLYKISSGGTPLKSNREYYEGGTIKWVKTGDLKQQYLYDTEDCITELGLSKSSARMYEENTVLIAMYGATIGATSILKIPACTNQACAAFPLINSVIPEYLYYFLRSKKSQFVKDGVGGAQPNISGSYLKDVEIDLLDLKEQRKIVNILDELGNIILNREQQMKQFDDLIKSRFVEMFGDPVINPKKWEMVELSELADIKIGPFGTLLHKEDYISGGHPLVNPSHIIDGKICYDINLTISDEKYEELEPYTLRKGDLILGRRGEMGRCAVVNEEGLLCGTGSLIIRSNGEIGADIMQKIISFPSYKKTIEDKAVGQTMPNLNVPIVSRFLIPRIPGEVQEEYFQFVQQVDKLKVEVQQSLDEIQTLFDSLMQKYFE